MKLLKIFVLVIFSIGCTTLKHIEASPQEVQEMILSENLIQLHDHVKITTVDGKINEFAVTNIDLVTGTISGEELTIEIENIIVVEKRDLSIGKTYVLIEGILGIIVEIRTALSPPCASLRAGP